MNKIFIFSGTTEGKMISKALSDAFIYHTVFVATEYGKLVMEPSEYADIKEGRLDEEKMRALFLENKPSFVVDATHPYASIVSENIRTSLESLNLINSYIRVARESEKIKGDIHVKKIEEAIETLENSEGNILLTTGVKSLPLFMDNESLKDRIYARILPSIESLSIALDTGIKPGHIICQEGPFSIEANEALLSMYDIKTLVTKNSGDNGGYKEKLFAAKNKNVKTLVIDPSNEDFGISVDEAVRLITNKQIDKKVTIAGIGVGDIDNLTLGVKKAIEKADLIIGAERMALFGQNINNKAKVIFEYEADKIADAIEKYNPENAVILMSGDTGFHSGCKLAKKELNDRGFEVNVLPGISSISYFSSKIGWDYDGKIFSLHGEKIDINELAQNEDKFFLILSGPGDIEVVKSALSIDWEVAVGFNLGYEDMKIDISNATKIKEYKDKGLYVLAARK